MRTVQQLRSLSALLLLTHCMLSAAPCLPSERSTTWNPGIPGDTPFDTMTIIDAVEKYSIPNDSSADATPPLQTVLNDAAAAGGAVVYLRGSCCYRSLPLPPGIYLVFWKAVDRGASQVVQRVTVP